jgi:putative transposon-encoded protein
MSQLEIPEETLFLNEARARHRDLMIWQERAHFFVTHHPDVPGWVRCRGYKNIQSHIEKHYRYDLIKYLFREERRINTKVPSTDNSMPAEITTTAKPIGTGAHVYVPKTWRGKQVRVILVE